ncbi:hypothetical protein [Desulfobacterium sp. N47]|uniref:Uncharacterized protein n=1 Tax=uncultured Desulfobacterium sp. TaxID=201089 RepID=E1YI03_9BACT|nr:hypothetical protein N47_D30810 [uncultured Desulfobacterium sp.]
MQDLSLSYHRYSFLGCEFLLWLWFCTSNPDSYNLFDNKNELIEIGNKIVLERNMNNSLEKITIKGEEAGLEEAMLSLKKGSIVKELNLLYKKEDKEWSFTLTGESLSFSNLKTPDIGFIESKKDVEGFVVEKMYLYNSIYSLIDNLYKNYILLRISDKWINITTNIKTWINS